MRKNLAYYNRIRVGGFAEKKARLHRTFCYTRRPVKIAIIGLGYVGLPLCLQFARNGVQVVGLDIDGTKVKAINAGKSYIQHIESAAIAAEVKAKRLSASTD